MKDSEKKNPLADPGPSEEADKKEIRKSYHRLAKRYHPDRNPGNPETGDQFEEMQMAYDTLISRTSMSGRPKAPDFRKKGAAPRPKINLKGAKL